MICSSSKSGFIISLLALVLSVFVFAWSIYEARRQRDREIYKILREQIIDFLFELFPKAINDFIEPEKKIVNKNSIDGLQNSIYDF